MWPLPRPVASKVLTAAAPGQREVSILLEQEARRGPIQPGWTTPVTFAGGSVVSGL